MTIFGLLIFASFCFETMSVPAGKDWFIWISSMTVRLRLISKWKIGTIEAAKNRHFIIEPFRCHYCDVKTIWDDLKAASNDLKTISNDLKAASDDLEMIL